MVIKIKENVIYVNFQVNNSMNLCKSKEILEEERFNWANNEASFEDLIELVEVISHYDIPLAKAYEVVLNVRKNNKNAEIFSFPSIQKMVA